MEHLEAGGELLGVGLYSVAEAAALTGITRSKIARWLGGYKYGSKTYPALWQPQVSPQDGELYLGFLDLMELRVANLFLSQGISAQRVRKAIDLARREFDQSHPFASRQFSTDGRTVFLRVLDADGERLLDLFTSQFAFRKIVERSLRHIDFDGDLPVRWWPQGKSAGIVVDPSRCFGRPVEETSGVPAEILAHAFEAEGSVEQAARVWDVSPTAIRKAIKYIGRVPLRIAA
jgi:uncharacterized protein (DUF433 family)